MPSHIYYAILILSSFNSNLYLRTNKRWSSLTFWRKHIHSDMFTHNCICILYQQRIIANVFSNSKALFFTTMCQAMFIYSCICILTQIEELLLTYSVTQSVFHNGMPSHVYYTILILSSFNTIRTFYQMLNYINWMSLFVSNRR